MNNENKELLNNDIEINVSEENIILAPPVELFDEAKEIAQSTLSDEKFPFSLQYDSNQKEFLLSILETVGAIVEDDDDDGHVLATMMNMTQLAFIKRLNCIEGVKHETLHNPFLFDNPNKPIAKPISISAQAKVIGETFENKNVSESNVAAATVTASPRSSCGSDSHCSSCSSCTCNKCMSDAKEILDESRTNGCIRCPETEQWFKFTATKSKEYTIMTTGSADTVGILYDCCGNEIARNDDNGFNGTLNFKIVHYLTAGCTYYVKVRLYGYATGSYTLFVTPKIYANYVNINKSTITLEKGVTYELPITPNYTYKGYNGAQRIPGLSVSINPSNANEQKIWWWEQYGSILECSYGWDEDGDRYIHVTTTAKGIAKLYAQDWNENGKTDECSVTVITPYEKCLHDICGFSSEVTNLIIKLYNKVDNIFTSENALQKAWRCARVLSEFYYDYISYGIINKWDDVAGSVTTNEDRKTYFMNTLGYTESEYITLHNGLLGNKENADKYHDIIDFTHMQYALAARLAYTLEKDKLASNLFSGLYTGNYGIYTDEEISYLGGWLGDAVLTKIYGQGTTAMKNEDYMADLDAENIYRLLLQGYTSIDAMNVYYSNMNASNTRLTCFYNTFHIAL